MLAAIAAGTTMGQGARYSRDEGDDDRAQVQRNVHHGDARYGAVMRERRYFGTVLTLAAVTRNV